MLPMLAVVESIVIECNSVHLGFLANIGKEINKGDHGKLPRITVIDPGRNGGFSTQGNEYLISNKTDADYVDPIHTSTSGLFEPV